MSTGAAVAGDRAMGGPAVRVEAVRRCRCGTRLARDRAGDRCGVCEAAHRERLAAPPVVPAEFWAHPPLAEALALQHMGLVVRAYRCHPWHGRTPLPQPVIGDWLSLTQVQVSRLENGPARKHLDWLRFAARTLRIPADVLWFRPADDGIGAAMGAAEVTAEQVAEARRDLGRLLAVWRDAAGLSQIELARRLAYSRSTLANAETGRQMVTRAFWQGADRECGAAGALIAAFRGLDRLVQDQREQAARSREQAARSRQQRRRDQAGPAVPECGCGGIVVGRWTGRETLALREALRLSAREFAEHLGVTASTVSGWENPRTAVPLRLATQTILDQALKHADPDARARFAALLDCDAHARSGTGTGGGRSVARGSTVTPLRRPGQVRAAS